MKPWKEAYKPRGSSREQLLLAGAMWAAVGAVLFSFGVSWIAGGQDGTQGLALSLLAVGLGLAKSKLVLDRTAAKIVGRIGERGEGRCIGGFLSLRSWLLVAAMVGLGRILRTGFLPLSAAGVLYAAIGTGLFFSSRFAWRAWYRGETGQGVL